MKSKYKVVYLPAAQDDLMEIIDYIKEDDPEAAAVLIKKIDRSISRLRSYPGSGMIPNDERLKLLGYRMLVIDNHLVFYVVKDKTVEIRRVIHGRRRYSFLL